MPGHGSGCQTRHYTRQAKIYGCAYEVAARVERVVCTPALVASCLRHAGWRPLRRILRLQNLDCHPAVAHAELAEVGAVAVAAKSEASYLVLEAQVPPLPEPLLEAPAPPQRFRLRQDWRPHCLQRRASRHPSCSQAGLVAPILLLDGDYAPPGSTAPRRHSARNDRKCRRKQ